MESSLTDEQLKEMFPASIFQKMDGTWYAQISLGLEDGIHNFVNLTYRPQYVDPFNLGLEATSFSSKEAVMDVVQRCRKHLAKNLVVYTEQV